MRILLALSSLLLAGCATATYRETLPDRSTIEIRSIRWFWNTHSFSFTWERGTNRVTVQFYRSGIETNTVSQIAESVARGIATGLKP